MAVVRQKVEVRGKDALFKLKKRLCFLISTRTQVTLSHYCTDFLLFPGGIFGASHQWESSGQIENCWF